ncbi:AIM24 family protein [Aeromicrobium senzhongii]|uniref:AIM24 family protein n=1 Tax=Aeromicrobium senzhongii TaxID=2663859 RepID=A0ABX6SWB2_9ACTN|nr:AIM24 family protein [Aeromicrobium senzhongii]MTB87253.1 AIM24 family protein [Aeromicrobium senzhongii]QNL95678.1 AIM24 family protein [Aeromicrobium senzhongii]
MQSELFSQANLEKQTNERFVVQNPQMLRVSLGDDVLAVKGAMVAYQGAVTFNHESAGSMGRLLKKAVSGDDVPLMRVSGQGEVFFADTAGYVFLVQLTGDALSVSGRNLLAFDSSLKWDIKRVKAGSMMAGGLFNMELSGTGTVALHAVGQPVVLDCAQQPTHVDVNAAVAWSSHLQPQLVNSMNVRSMLRGGSGEAFQYRYHGQGFVVVQPSEWDSGASGSSGGSSGGGGGIIGDLFS